MQICFGQSFIVRYLKCLGHYMWEYGMSLCIIIYFLLKVMKCKDFIYLQSYWHWRHKNRICPKTLILFESLMHLFITDFSVFAKEPRFPPRLMKLQQQHLTQLNWGHWRDHYQWTLSPDLLRPRRLIPVASAFLIWKVWQLHWDRFLRRPLGCHWNKIYILISSLIF